MLDHGQVRPCGEFWHGTRLRQPRYDVIAERCGVRVPGGLSELDLLELSVTARPTTRRWSSRAFRSSIPHLGLDPNPISPTRTLHILQHLTAPRADLGPECRDFPEALRPCSDDHVIAGRWLHAHADC
jgi:hypothetical protein